LPRSGGEGRKTALSFLFVALGLLTVRPARAADPPPTFTAHKADGQSVEGRLRELGGDWSVRIGDATVKGDDLLTVRRADRPSPPLSAGAQILLAGGDSVPVRMDAKNGPRLIGDRVHFLCPVLAGGQDVTVPLSAMSAVWYGGAGGDDAERLRRRLVQEPHKRDLLLLKNGDVLEGALTALDGAGVTLEVNRRPVTIEIDRTAGVALSSALTEAPKPKGACARIVLDGPGEAAGARLSLASARCSDGATLTGETLFGAALSVSLSQVAAIDLFGGRAVYLSELNPSRYEYFPYLDDHWDWSRDADVTGLDLRLAGSSWDRGVGLHSHARLTYAVPKDARRFEALVGLDDRTGRDGSVRIHVLADGKPLDLAGDRELTAGAPLSVHVDVTGAKELTLEVDFGKGGPVQDHVDWVDARFVR
ncbi:MAG TPA: NPCBM/NEW2 domain-containing protein, partial [Gemmataceae bacterium]|nr:NPCBM/NEW2 domain-containing protein [Gemmataceae bacterium]